MERKRGKWMLALATLLLLPGLLFLPLDSTDTLQSQQQSGAEVEYNYMLASPFGEGGGGTAGV